ncbi:elongation factor P maturation arginine rhamnosyltransferase EarP [Rheinheimera sp. UJ63]|uniref:elongation factor P maturation arginine rhamnosyltransferase EarP n=1 Tax=Rheinheimera sp. UJ63 TaxID=2910157 RepID=UPI001F2B7F3B|nr:elongation factor P maturation arginine rhamnosyltransferase EarP [Rheinheimera sp. UJ63]MCF4009452.1 elongation factor P maturation arginine rhamnosyltransferase EarP [Rheinheimera sp. UJ63]
MRLAQQQRWDIFCAVVDNFGDIGICWRLSRQLVAEHGLAVRLWVDDLVSFQRLCPAIDPNLTEQQQAGVLICHWQVQTPWQSTTPGTVVVEALACTIPFAYQQQMAQQAVKPLWLNLEYLSAESWIEACHTMASPQPQLPLIKYFFFPGFSEKTGGLLCEQGRIAQLSAFQQDALAQQHFWQQLGISLTDENTLKVSLFAYTQQALGSLLALWQEYDRPVLCVIPLGALADQAKQLLPGLSLEQPWQAGSLTVHLLAFLPQPQYDYLLSACDINFVRGEDSVIRAQWAAKPFIWQIYRQAEQAHIDKLSAFLARYTAEFPAELASVVQKLHLQWNTEQDVQHSWQDFALVSSQIAQLNQLWRNKLESFGDLASNLVRFAEKKIIM